MLGEDDEEEEDADADADVEVRHCCLSGLCQKKDLC